MEKLISDSVKSEISLKVKGILRALFVEDWKSEAHNQHQNVAEMMYQKMKRKVTMF